MEDINNSGTSEEGQEAPFPPTASSSSGNIPSAWNAFIHVLEMLVQNGEASNEQTVGRLFIAFRRLSPLAFCAYSNPTKEQGWTECTNEGCRVQYLDWNWLQHAMKGVLKITLSNAQNVPKSDVFSESDSYIVFSTHGSRVASEIKEDDPNPVWHSKHLLLIKNHLVTEEDDAKLHLKLVDSDNKKYKPEERAARQILSKDDYLGSVSINLKDVLIQGEKKDWNSTLKLKKAPRSSQSTVVRFSTEFISLDQTLTEQPEKLKAFDFWKQQDPDSIDGSRWARWNMDKNSGDNQRFKPVAFVNAMNTGTQAWIFVDESIKTVAVVFRGTEKKRIKDFLTVLQFRSSKLSLEKIKGCNLELSTDAQDKKIRVHKGFKDAYHSIRKTVWQIVYATTGWSEEWKVCTTGHSLGGALAALCAFDYANTRDESGTRPKIFVMNFGCPRIGNKSFQELYDKTVEYSCRVAIGRDIICRLPPHLNHVGSELHFENTGEVLWRGESVKEIQVDDPDESKDSKDTARARWQSIVESVKTENRLKWTVAERSGSTSAMDLPLLRRVFGFSWNGRRIRGEFVASGKPGRACCFTRLFSMVTSIDELQNEKGRLEKSKKNAHSWLQFIKDHTEPSYRRFFGMCTHVDPTRQSTVARSAQRISSEEHKIVFDAVCTCLRFLFEKRSPHSDQHKNNYE